MKHFTRTPLLLLGALGFISLGLLLAAQKDVSPRTSTPVELHLLIRNVTDIKGDDETNFRKAVDKATGSTKSRYHIKYHHHSGDPTSEGDLDSFPASECGGKSTRANVTQQVVFSNTTDMVTFLNAAFP